MSTYHQQIQHSAFLGADNTTLQSRIQEEVSKYDTRQNILKNFLLNFIDPHTDPTLSFHASFKYRNILQDIYDNRRDDLPIFMDDLKEHFNDEKGEDLKTHQDASVYDSFLINTPRYIEFLYEAADAILSDEDLFRHVEDAIRGITGRNDPEQKSRKDRLNRNESYKQRNGNKNTDDDHNTDDENERNDELDLNAPLGELPLLQRRNNNVAYINKIDILTEKWIENKRRNNPWNAIRNKDMRIRRVPASLRASYRIVIHPHRNESNCLFRQIDANVIGKQSFFQGEVVRVLQTKPRCLVAAFECEECHDKVFQPVDDEAFMPMFNCPVCKLTAQKTSSLNFHPKLSLFLPYQEIKIQEPTYQIPEADVPRTLTCHLLGHALTQLLQPGVTVTIGGILKPVKKMGFVGRNNGNYQEKYFDVNFIQHEKAESSLDKREVAYIEGQIEKLKKKQGLYDLLAKSIAPGVYGMEDVKKALLLQMIGGEMCIKSDGGVIRGDIHVLLMGDPGIAKSQLLKQVCQIAPRGVYTTGKGSSSSGLTAAVVRDPQSLETFLEGGALVLADRGICCIDEFDKMDDFDRSAIYEVMEQQSVSIAKAGQCSALPARAAVLAAANPKDGRYDIRKPMLVNMNLPAALLSRFDLQFLLLDIPDRDNDMLTATHILNIFRRKYEEGIIGCQWSMADSDNKGTEFSKGVRCNRNSPKKRKNSQRHQHGTKNNPSVLEYIEKKTLRAFVAKAKTFSPKLPDSLIPQLIEWYSSARQVEHQEELISGILPSYTTPRALLGILRLSQSLARLRFSEKIEYYDVEEALRLFESSKASVKVADSQRTRRRKIDKNALVYDLLKRTRTRVIEKRGQRWDGWIKLSQLEHQSGLLNITPLELHAVLKHYEDLTIITYNSNRSKVAFVDDAQTSNNEEDYEEYIEES